MTEFILTINEIVKYGLEPNLPADDRERLLEKNLIKIYSLYFEIDFVFDETEYPDFDKSIFPNVRENIQTNFSDFGFYKAVRDITDINNEKDNCIGDAIDDLTDIILDLLEVKWRIEHNSLADGLWYFQLVFYSHTQQHILDLLNYMKRKKGLY